ncbi:hypothetical protein V5O39_31095 [Pseudomonas parakoreensis]
MSEGDGAGIVDFLQGAGEFGGENWCADQSGRNGCAQDRETMRIKFSSNCFFYGASSSALLCFECLTAPEVLARQAFVERV